MGTTEPQIVTRAPQPFAAMVLELTQPEIAQQAPPLIGDVIAWMEARRIAPDGPPFFNYVDHLPGGRMRMEVGMPAAAPVTGEGEVIGGTLPGGRYASLMHTGPYNELMDANMALMDWMKANGHELAGDTGGAFLRDVTCLEVYHKDPGEDPSGHPVTEVAFLVR